MTSPAASNTQSTQKRKRGYDSFRDECQKKCRTKDTNRVANGELNKVKGGKNTNRKAFLPVPLQKSTEPSAQLSLSSQSKPSTSKSSGYIKTYEGQFSAIVPTSSFTFGEDEILQNLRTMDTGLSDVIDNFTENVEAATSTEANTQEKVTKSKKQSAPTILKFIRYRVDLLKELVRNEGPIAVTEKCTICCGEDTEASAVYRCQKCFGCQARCKKCIVKCHVNNPLHRIEQWNGYHWSCTTLQELGHIIYLGHDGKMCPYYLDHSKEHKVTEVTVLDVGGIQSTSVCFCECDQRLGLQWEYRNQVIKHQWFPATYSRPSTVATFALLDLYEQLSSQGKISGYDFYKSLVSLTDNSGVGDETRRYEEFMSMTRRYLHLKMLERAGFGTCAEKIDQMSAGDLAVECPACPHPSRNLPQNWKEDEEKWKHSDFVMVDANFKQKRRAKKTKEDPDLAAGCAYFVEDKKYKEFLSGFKDEKETKHCSSELRAVGQANLRGGKGYDVSGILAVQCKHMLYKGNGVVDLQRGERFCNSDYAVLSALASTEVERVVLSYDIACTYGKKLRSRLSKYPVELQIPSSVKQLDMVIPMFHIVGHGEVCQTRYSLSFRPHMGRTDGENIERGWAAFNPQSMQLREMGHGSRRDVLNIHLGMWNWMRIKLMGLILKNRLRDAIKMVANLTDAHEGFSTSFAPHVLYELTRKIEAWNKDPDRSEDPYVDPRLLARGRRSVSVSPRKGKGKIEQVGEDFTTKNVSTALWLRMGLKLEDEKLVVKDLYRSLKSNSASAKYTAAEEMNKQLLRKIQLWHSKLIIMMPTLSGQWNIELDVDPEDDGDMETESSPAWEVELALPSNVPSAVREEYCGSSIIAEEFAIREEEAHDALNNIRQLLLKERVLRLDKQRYASGVGQRNITRSERAIQSLEDIREEQVKRYEVMHAAMERIDPGGRWNTVLQELERNDIKAPFRDVANDGDKEKGWKPSWIWTMPDTVDIGTEMNDAEKGEMNKSLCVEWAKSKARMDRWKEEVILVKEEMRRVLAYMEWKALKWLSVTSITSSATSERELGALAYANKQALILKSMAEKFRGMWIPLTGSDFLPVFGELPLKRLHEVGKRCEKVT